MCHLAGKSVVKTWWIYSQAAELILKCPPALYATETTEDTVFKGCGRKIIQVDSNLIIFIYTRPQLVTTYVK